VTRALPAAVTDEITAALDRLEATSLASRLAATVGVPVERLRARMPPQIHAAVEVATQRALDAALSAALASRPGWSPPGVGSTRFHRALLAGSGVLGGAGGLAGTLLELPVSTTLLLRQVAAVAIAEGEDVTRPEGMAECLTVFALGGHTPGADAADTGYFAVRLALAEAVPGLVASAASGWVTSLSAAIAARFAGPVATKALAQAAPLLGAAAGAAVNLAFLEHFRGVAGGHFAIRRLEREHGPARVRAAAADLRSLRDARFLG
jgi:hypothetical protein